MTDHERLQVEQPKRGEKHQAHRDREQPSHKRITKGSQDRQAEHREISDGANQSEGNSVEGRVRTAENFRTTADDCAANALAGDVLDGEVNRVCQSHQRHTSDNDEKLRRLRGEILSLNISPSHFLISDPRPEALPESKDAAVRGATTRMEPHGHS